MYNVTFELAIFNVTEYVFCLYFLPLYLCFASIKNNLIRISVPPDYIKYVSLYEHVLTS